MADIETYFLYQGVHTTQQVKNIKEFFEFFLKKEKFDTIIELGTSLAGLTYIIDDICVENSLSKKIHTFDFSYKDYVDNQLKDRNIEYHIMDETTEEFKNYVIRLINNGGKVLLLCDGGNKINEFNFYSDYIKNGDLIMAHDYAHDDFVFEKEIKNKIWNWYETKYSDIQDSIKRNNLVKYEDIDFEKAAWCCFKKNTDVRKTIIEEEKTETLNQYDQTIGLYLYEGQHIAQQVKNIKNYFTFLLNEEKFDVIVEIGTSYGGLTYILSDILKENNLKHNIHTFDLTYQDYTIKHLEERNCNYYQMDERDAEYKNKVVDLLTNHGKALLLCDGGNKIEEFNRYSEFLKFDDIIMAHDYCENLEIFEKDIKNKYWNWCEIKYSDIEDSVIKHSLVKYDILNFKKAAWCCYRKWL